MKVIFLDHDGVICLSLNYGTRFKKQKELRKLNPFITDDEIPWELRFDNFDRKAIKVLNEILTETDVEIIVSSDWRKYGTLEEMKSYYELQGIIKQPMAFTPIIKSCNNYDENYIWENGWDLEQTRCLEIKQYLKDNPNITHWVAVDDLNMGKTGIKNKVKFTHDWGLDNFVLTPRGTEGIKQFGVKEKILNFLK